MKLLKPINAKQTRGGIRGRGDMQAHRRSGFLTAAGRALNRLTGLNLDYRRRMIIRKNVFRAIRPEAFEKWLKAARARQTPAGKSPA